MHEILQKQELNSIKTVGMAMCDARLNLHADKREQDDDDDCTNEFKDFFYHQ